MDLSILADTMSEFKTSLVQLEDILNSVAHIVILPPIGQIISAAIAVSTMLINGAASVKQCCEMAVWMNKLLYLVRQQSFS
jgi:hypothetical protein